MTLERELANLEKAIKRDLEAAEKAGSHYERERLEKRAWRTREFEIPAVKKAHAEREAKQAANAAALEAHERQIANQNLEQFKSAARIRYIQSGAGTSKDFEAAWPSILAVYQRESALGRMPQAEPTKSDIGF